MIDPDQLDPAEWVSTRAALRLLGRPRDYGRLRWLHSKGYLRTRLEVSERVIYWKRAEVAAVVLDDLRRRAGPNETYSASVMPRSKPANKPARKRQPMKFARRGH